MAGDTIHIQEPKMDSNHIDYDESDYDLDSAIWDVQALQDAARKMRLVRPRSLAWAILMHVLPCNDACINQLRSYRSMYKDLSVQYSRDPRLETNDDPLSQKNESAWNQHFCDNELKALILQDVIRTFPEEQFFRNQDIQDLMVRVLFIWARKNPGVGYRQGMHEILAPLLYELHLDIKLAPDNLSEILNEILDKAYLEHDSFMMFVAIMRGLEIFYQTGNAVPSANGRLPKCTSPHVPNEVAKYLERIKSEHLVPLDPALSSHLDRCNISLELFGIRWLRLLFGREFPRDEISSLWSFLFANGPQLPLIDHVIVAMLISMRNTLLDSDPGVVLSALMRPSGLKAQHIAALALHLRHPLVYSRPATPPPFTTEDNNDNLENYGITSNASRAVEDDAEEGVAEGADVARELATLAILRAQLPRAATQLAHALPRAPQNVVQPLSQILQLAALLQCRNHALIDVETALEAGESENFQVSTKRQIIAVNIHEHGNRAKSSSRKSNSSVNTTKEVPLQVFAHMEVANDDTTDHPSFDPLKLRTN